MSPFMLPPKTTYHDNPADRIFIALFSRKMSKALGASTGARGYEGFVDLSKQIMQGRTAQQQQELVSVVLKSLVPTPVLWGIRTFFNPSPLICELNAWFASRLFEWLVGPCRVTATPITKADGSTQLQNSGVHIERCRYLEHSGCVGMCINMCKLPTQEFFTQEFGIPVTLNPNFEDLSCDMIFGQLPPPLVSEDIYQQPCLAEQCDTAQQDCLPCPKIRR